MIERATDGQTTASPATGAGFGQPAAYAAASGYAAVADPPARSNVRITLIALILTALLGAVAGGWVGIRWLAPTPLGQSINRQAARLAPQSAAAPNAATRPVAAASIAAPAISTMAEQPMLTARIAVLEERLARISIAADSASGNAAKAEAILVAFAARRALDRGVGLGSMEAQLRLRFAETQPNAVESIIFAAANPVTQEELVQRLDGLRTLAVADGNTGWLTRIGNNLSSLVTIRRSDAPSADPAQRFDRALRATIAGRVDQAIVEVEAMPGGTNQAVQYWLRDARRYYDARRALDLIETAALVEPGANRGPAAR